jgi:hypothetical protein
MEDDPHHIANNPSAPADERFDAQSELAQTYRPTAADLPDTAQVLQFAEYVRNGIQESELLKAQALSTPQRAAPRARGMQSLYLDNRQVLAHGGYFDKPATLGFEALRRMVDQTPVLNAVIMTRIRQVQRFCRPQTNGSGPGFCVAHIDPDHKPDAKEKESMQVLQQFMRNSGFEHRPRMRKRLRRDNFSNFMAKLVRDTLTFDACPIEVERKHDQQLGLDGFYAVDGSTIRLCSEEGYEGDDEIFAVQAVNSVIHTTYTLDDMIYEVRNPRTDINLSGYGLGETELLIRVVTGFLNAMSYNIKGFDSNAIPKGLLQLYGDYDESDLAAFKRIWNSWVKGVNNAWSLPVLAAKDKESGASFERFGIEFNEMYFAKWMTFLVSIICAIYSMGPDEINFESFAAQKSALAGSDTEEKLADSKDKGLRPLLSFFENTFSDYLVGDFSDKYLFRWTGLDEEDAKSRFERQKLVMSVDEMRAIDDLPAMDEWGSAPINPSLMPAWMQANQPPDPMGEAGGDAPPAENNDTQSEAEPMSKAFPVIYNVG